jgi:hypothetical protein
MVQEVAIPAVSVRRPLTLRSLSIGTLFVLLALSFNSMAFAQYFPNFSAAATEDSNVQLGSAAAMVSWTPSGSVTPQLLLAFKQNNSSNGLFITTAPDAEFGEGTTRQISGITMAAGPGAVVFDNQLYVAYQSNDGENALCLTSSPDGVSFTAPVCYYNAIPIFGQPSMTVFNNQIYIAFRTTSNGYIGIAHGIGVSNLSYTSYQPQGLASGSAPGLGVYNGKLYMALQQNNSQHNMYMSVSTDGQNFTTTEYTNIQFGGAPTVIVYNNTLLVAFQQNNSTHDLFIASSTDGTTYGLKQYTVAMMGTAGALATFELPGTSDIQLYLVYQQNNSSHNLFYNYANN